MDGPASILSLDGSSDHASPQTNTPNDQMRNIDSYFERHVGLCQTLSLVLNAGLMLYAHLGLSGVILSSIDPSVSSSVPPKIGSNNDVAACNEQDKEIWTSNGGVSALQTESEFCGKSYDGGCLTNVTCTESCFEEQEGYSDECAACFGSLVPCAVSSGCALLCISDSASAECQECLVPCVEKFIDCTGFPELGNEATPQDQTALPPSKTTGDSCNSFDLDAIETWYSIYEVRFIQSVKDSWNNGAKLLAIIIVLFSGAWPYAKNILVLVVWYLPMTVERQTSVLLWLSWLSKYSLVDVFAVIGILVGVQLQLNIGGVVEAVIRAEPRFGILCIFLATVWGCFQIKLVKVMHERKVLSGQLSQDEEERVLFSQLWIPVLTVLTSIALFVSGTATEFLYITTTDYGSEGTCVKSYNIVQLGNALINNISMTGNSAAGQTWFLYLGYVVLILGLPVLTHLMQIIYIAGHVYSKRLTPVIEWTSALRCFACIEVLLIGIFPVQSKFEHLIGSIAGVHNKEFLDVSSGLGSGFYILIAYSVISCACQFSLEKTSDSSTQLSSKRSNVDEKESDPTYTLLSQGELQ